MPRRKERETTGPVCETFCFDPERVNRVRVYLPEVEGLSELFKVLGDETRTKIVYALSHEELCVCDLANLLGLTVSAVSHHLRLLRSMRLVKFRKEGKQVYYSLDDEHIIHLIQEAQAHFSETGQG